MIQDVSILDEYHKLYRSDADMLLYLVKYSRPDIANAVRELSKGFGVSHTSKFQANTTVHHIGARY